MILLKIPKYQIVQIIIKIIITYYEHVQHIRLG